MLEGTYVVLAQTPVGRKRGEVTFSHGVNGALRAVLNVRGLNIALSGARAECDFFELSGTISHVLMGKAPFTCTGSVEGDRLTATGVGFHFDLAERYAQRAFGAHRIKFAQVNIGI